MSGPATSAGRALLTVDLVDRESAVTSAYATHPLKLLTPRPRGAAVWACTSSFGGGLVTGDRTHLDIHLRTQARCFLGTQASTKIYRAGPPGACQHTTVGRLDPGSVLVFAPDPVQAFADSRYRQRQTFDLAPDASLVLVDWMSSGRPARGERWAFSHFASRNEIRRAGQLVFLDSLRLDPADGPLDGPARMGRFDCLAVAVAVGPAFQAAAREWVETSSRTPLDARAAVIHSASPLTDGAVLRVAGPDTESVARFLLPRLAFVGSVLGDDPWSRKW